MTKDAGKGIHPGFETYAKVTKIPKRVSVTPQKGLMSSKQIIFLKSWRHFRFVLAQDREFGS